MVAIRRRLHACTWLALTAMLALAIGPTISRLTLPETGGPMGMDHAAMHHAALHHAGMNGGDGVAMADAQAMPAVHHHHSHPPAGPASPPPGHTHSLEHCALCVVALSAFAVAPAPLPLVTPVCAPLQEPLPRDRGVAPGRDIWSPIGSRGPPALA